MSLATVSSVGGVPYCRDVFSVGTVAKSIDEELFISGYMSQYEAVSVAANSFVEMFNEFSHVDVCQVDKPVEPAVQLLTGLESGGIYIRVEEISGEVRYLPLVGEDGLPVEEADPFFFDLFLEQYYGEMVV